MRNYYYVRIYCFIINHVVITKKIKIMNIKKWMESYIKLILMRIRIQNLKFKKALFRLT